MRLTLYVSAPSASSSSSSLALKCIFLNSRLLIEGQDDDAGGRSLEGREHLLQARVAQHEHPSPGSGPPHHGSVLPTGVMEGERKDSGFKAKASPANAGEPPREPQTTATTSHPAAGSRLSRPARPHPRSLWQRFSAPCGGCRTSATVLFSPPGLELLLRLICTGGTHTCELGP